MKYIKLFEARKTESDIAEICELYDIKNWSINPEGLVDVDGSVNLFRSALTKLPLNFGYVSGDFWCQDNQLTSLHGSPQSVGKGFNCSGNELTSLEGSPISVNGSFHCYNNQLTSLEGASQGVGRHFLCQDNQLTSLGGSPKYVGGSFQCFNNQLTSLEGCPQSVEGDFWCQNNQLTSLRFAPEEIGGRIYILPNPILDIPKKYLTREYLPFIVKEQSDWRLYNKDGSIRLDRLEEMIEWGIETNKIAEL
jgi:hypothetical protein